MRKKISILMQKLLPKYFYDSLKRLYRLFRKILFQLKLLEVQFNHKTALRKVRKKAKRKEKIKVVFLLIHDSVWKYEGVYRLFQKDERFDPLVVICPYIARGEETMFYEMDKAFIGFSNKKYRVVKSLNENGCWLDIKKEIKPDLVFFTNPFKLTRPEYLISYFSKILTCYVPYGFKNSYLYYSHFNQDTQNFAWKFFLETDIHQKLSKQYAMNKSINTVVTGYPGMDVYMEKDYKPKDVWKIKDRNVKRIIWAPHHTISGNGATLDYSTFITYCDFMFEIAKKYKGRIQIAFKPHPILRPNLSKPEVWGKNKTDDYYNKWNRLDNGQLNEAEYIDLFITSDAMIHDSSSFVIEYLYTSRPVMFLVHDDAITNRFNEVGQMAFTKLYQGRNREQIESFIVDVVLDESDIKKEERLSFVNNLVRPPNNMTASENIYRFLINEIFN